MTYHIGDTFPLDRSMDITTGKMDAPAWHPLWVAPQKERAAREALKAKGVFAFYPFEEMQRWAHGRKITWQRPSITRLIYAKFTHYPQWHILRLRRMIIGPMSVNGVPIIIPSETIRQLQGLPTEAERLEEARLELQRLRVGDVARITQGPLAGKCVDINSIRGGVGWFDSLIGIRGSAQVDKLERVT